VWCPDEPLKFRDDECLNLVQHDLKEMIERECSSIAHDRCLPEMYRRAELAIHLHGAISQSSGRLNFCAVLKCVRRADLNAALESSCFCLANSTNRNFQISVFVDVRELRKKTKRVVKLWPPIVRLYTLDELIRRCGKPWKSFGEFALRARCDVGTRRLSVSRDFDLKRKYTIFLPTGSGRSFRQREQQFPAEERSES